jgi:leucyl aminopeptidase
MKINFKAKKNKDILFVKVDKKYEDGIIKEGDIKTLYLKEDKEMNLRKFFLLIRKIVQTAKKSKIEKISLDFGDFKFKRIKEGDEYLGEIIGSQLELANYSFSKYKSKKEETLIKEVIVTGANNKTQKSILVGQKIGQEVNKTRDLSNTPGGDMTPAILASKAIQAVKNLPVKVTVWGEKEMKKRKMEAILAVGKGSKAESKFIIMEYWGASKTKKPVVLVGKGVTFDSGGINLKPSSGMPEMKMDMSGGAGVIHALALVAKRKLKKNVIGIVPAVENFISGESYRPGDVIKSLSGQTIEVLNTDAEGRVIMADALHYSKKYKPSLVVDVATLTGASLVALGDKKTGLFTDDDKLADLFMQTGEKTGEYLWRLPMDEEYENDIKGSLGDWTNIHNKNSNYGGATYAAVFLKQFIKGYPWVHLDIAPRMTSTPADLLAPGSLGTSVYLLYKLIEKDL